MEFSTLATTLTKLMLNGMEKLSDTSIIALLDSCSQLRFVCVNGTQITDMLCLHLTKEKRKLERLEMKNCPKISARGVGALERSKLVSQIEK